MQYYITSTVARITRKNIDVVTFTLFQCVQCCDNGNKIFDVLS